MEERIIQYNTILWQFPTSIACCLSQFSIQSPSSPWLVIYSLHMFSLFLSLFTTSPLSLSPSLCLSSYFTLSNCLSIKEAVMGICTSCESTYVATAKLILQDGRLQEFSYPVKVSNVLQQYPSIFICNSDEMEFDDVVSAISDDEDLQPGQLYFALPLSRLRHPLQPEEMAALAVKASSALSKSGVEKCGCHRNAISAVAFTGKKYNSEASRKAEYGGGVGDRGLIGGRRGGGGGGSSRRSFKVALSAIPE